MWHGDLIYFVSDREKSGRLNLYKMPAAGGDAKSPETYLGYGRGENFGSAEEVAEDRRQAYSIGEPLGLNEWGLVGDWTIGKDHAALEAPNGRLAYRFHARDLHLVLGPSDDGRPVRFRMARASFRLSASTSSSGRPKQSPTISSKSSSSTPALRPTPSPSGRTA